ncbi:MAG: MgtC/SapB family protein [Microvirga sp.]|nr:MgtC/SapB family protein [Microvirga sp.]
MIPLVCSLVAGALVGLEREYQGKPAGLRTHALVCFASALMTLLGLRMSEWTADLPVGTEIVSDMARMPHAILTGIGFLCAGVIFREGATVQGLTTAASLWLTAALGIVFGAGLVELATIGTGIALLVLVLLQVVQCLMPAKPEIRLEVAVSLDSSYDGAALTSDLAAEGLQVTSMAARQDSASGLRRYVMLASGTDRSIDVDRLLRTLQRGGAMQEVAISPLINDPEARA